MPKRPEGTEPTVEWKLRLPASLVAQVELLLMDPMKRKPRYGERSVLVSNLLRRHLQDVNFSVSKERERLYPAGGSGESESNK